MSNLEERSLTAPEKEAFPSPVYHSMYKRSILIVNCKKQSIWYQFCYAADSQAKAKRKTGAEKCGMSEEEQVCTQAAIIENHHLHSLKSIKLSLPSWERRSKHNRLYTDSCLCCRSLCRRSFLSKRGHKQLGRTLLDFPVVLEFDQFHWSIYLWHALWSFSMPTCLHSRQFVVRLGNLWTLFYESNDHQMQMLPCQIPCYI